MRIQTKPFLLAALILSLSACGGGGSDDAPGPGGDIGGDNSGGGSGNDIMVSVEIAGEGNTSLTEQSVSSGESVRFTVTPAELMVTESVDSDGCTIDVIGDEVYVDEVASSCTVNVTFEDCTDCYTNDDIVLEYAPYRELMARNCIRGGLVATGSENVPWHNLCQAADTLATMTEYNSVVVDQLQSVGAITAVFGPDEKVCDLPYYDWIQGEPQCDTADGGLGGVPGNPVTSCSALTLSATNDVFNRGDAEGENTCVHELAHTIMTVGVGTEINQEIYNRYYEVYDGDELWLRENGERSFALTNGDEFFAEIVQSYFSANVSVDSFNHVGVNGADKLEAYDPISFELVDRIFMEPANLK